MDETGVRFATPVAQERRPVSAEQLRLAGVDLARDFPGAGIEEFREYPVLSEGGWFMVIKHQPTLTTVSRTPWTLLGPVTLLSHGLEFD